MPFPTKPGPCELPIWIPGTRIIDVQSIQRARKLRGMTVEMLGQKLSISHTTISRWERGLTTPSGIYRREVYRFLVETNRVIRMMVKELQEELQEEG